MKKGDLIKFGFGILILVILVYKIGFKEAYFYLLNIKLWYLPLLILFIFFILLIGAINIKVLLSGIKTNISFRKIFRYSNLSWAYGMVAPGKIGEFSIIYLLNKEGIKLGEGAVISILDKLITIFSLILIAVIWLFTGPNAGINLTQALIILSSLLILFIFLMVWGESRKFIRRYILRKYAKKFKNFYKTLSRYFKKEKMLLFYNFIITLIKWFVSALLPFLVFLSIGVYVPLIIVFMFSAIITIISLVPLTMSGLGIKESAAVILYNYILGINPAIVLSVYITIALLKYISAFFIVITNPIKD